ncbi:hypothetical protein NDU88_006846 [Pleurodeles waltl]|uniref:Uncharacterized protein n=1 Tax=Pleurodeles waltl TaxID=8319 RepID=A0AAV7U1A0_PLEWA|nr:hypothetical protein NDU88_006846 [Pleurodeles waltl]
MTATKASSSTCLPPPQNIEDPLGCVTIHEIPCSNRFSHLELQDLTYVQEDPILSPRYSSQHPLESLSALPQENLIPLVIDLKKEVEDLKALMAEILNALKSIGLRRDSSHTHEGTAYKPLESLSVVTASKTSQCFHSHTVPGNRVESTSGRGSDWSCQGPPFRLGQKELAYSIPALHSSPSASRPAGAENACSGPAVSVPHLWLLGAGHPAGLDLLPHLLWRLAVPARRERWDGVSSVPQWSALLGLCHVNTGARHSRLRAPSPAAAGLALCTGPPDSVV